MKINELLHEAVYKRHKELKPVTDARCLIDVLTREFNLSFSEVAELLGHKNKSERDR